MGADEMTGKGSQHRAKPGFLLRRKHEAFQVPQPNNGSFLVRQNGQCSVHQVVQRNPREVNPLRLSGHPHGVHRQHWSPQGPSL
jgi:hypothetical protein